MTEDNSNVPTNRAIKIPSTMVYQDINTIMQIFGREKRSKDAVLNCRANTF